MKPFLFLIALIATLASSARADNGITCLSNHEEAADAVLKKTILDSVTAGLAKKGITLKAGETSFDISAEQVNFEDDGQYGYFTADSGNLTAQDGTTFTLSFVGYSPWDGTPDDREFRFYYKPVMKSKGFDKEGNAIAAHCTLIFGDVRVTDRASGVEVRNEKTGRTILKFPAPAKISVY